MVAFHESILVDLGTVAISRRLRLRATKRDAHVISGISHFPLIGQAASGSSLTEIEGLFRAGFSACSRDSDAYATSPDRPFANADRFPCYWQVCDKVRLRAPFVAILRRARFLSPEPIGGSARNAPALD
jgi:hypothetical protein